MLKEKFNKVLENKRFDRIPQTIIDKIIDLFMYACIDDDKYQETIKNNNIYVNRAIRDVYLELNGVSEIEFLTLYKDKKIQDLINSLPTQEDLTCEIFKETFLEIAFFRTLESYIPKYNTKPIRKRRKDNMEVL